MGNFKYTNSTVGTCYDERTGKFLNQELKTDNVDAVNMSAYGIKADYFKIDTIKNERSLQFYKDGDLSAYFFFHPTANSVNGTVGLYDAKGPRAVFRTVLGTDRLSFCKHIVPESYGGGYNFDIGASNAKWRHIYHTGSIYKSYALEAPKSVFNATEDIMALTFSKDGLVKPANSRSEETDYNESELIMTMGKALQDALARIEELEAKIQG